MRLSMDKFSSPLFLLISRVLLALIFVAAGANKIGHYNDTVAYMQSMGVAGMLLPAVIVLELGGGLAILLGAFVRPVAVVLAGFCVISGALFHSQFADQIQTVMFMKNLAMAGGFLALAVAGGGAWSVDSRVRGLSN